LNPIGAKRTRKEREINKKEKVNKIKNNKSKTSMKNKKAISTNKKRRRRKKKFWLLSRNS